MKALGARLILMVLAACAMAAEAGAMSSAGSPAASLRGKYVAMASQLRESPLREGLYLESAESPGALRGDIYAVVDFPIATVSNAFRKSENWCDALLLHLNVKFCQAEHRGESTVLSVAIGRKFDEPLSDTHRVEFMYRATLSGSGYTEITLDARDGPLDTRNYQLSLEMIGLSDQQSFVHVRYSYDYGITARLAMGAYLATLGRGKVGFTMLSGEDGGSPHLIGGLRGALERNTMRYYLAFDAYLGALSAPAARRFEEGIERWFTATERYALQLHEVEHDDYIAMKRGEYLRQQAPR